MDSQSSLRHELDAVKSEMQLWINHCMHLSHELQDLRHKMAHSLDLVASVLDLTPQHGRMPAHCFAGSTAAQAPSLYEVDAQSNELYQYNPSAASEQDWTPHGSKHTPRSAHTPEQSPCAARPHQQHSGQPAAAPGQQHYQPAAAPVSQCTASGSPAAFQLPMCPQHPAAEQDTPQMIISRLIASGQLPSKLQTSPHSRSSTADISARSGTHHTVASDNTVTPHSTEQHTGGASSVASSVQAPDEDAAEAEVISAAKLLEQALERMCVGPPATAPTQRPTPPRIASAACTSKPPTQALASRSHVWVCCTCGSTSASTCTCDEGSGGGSPGCDATKRCSVDTVRSSDAASSTSTLRASQQVVGHTGPGQPTPQYRPGEQQDLNLSWYSYRLAAHEGDTAAVAAAALPPPPPPLPPTLGCVRTSVILDAGGGLLGCSHHSGQQVQVHGVQPVAGHEAHIPQCYVKTAAAEWPVKRLFDEQSSTIGSVCDDSRDDAQQGTRTAGGGMSARSSCMGNESQEGDEQVPAYHQQCGQAAAAAAAPRGALSPQNLAYVSALRRMCDELLQHVQQVPEPPVLYE